MDFSKFSDDDFDMKSWINTALESHNDSSTVDQHTSSLVMKLQLFIQEVSKSLEETSQLALNNIPRVLREVDAIKTESGLLKNQMVVVKDDIRKVEESTAHSMKRLVDIDSVKTRMQSASCALQEADNWSTLSSEVNAYFEEEDVEQVAKKLIGMQNSLNVLQDVPDYADRYRMLENLKNKLEAMLSTKLVKTFMNHNLEDARYYVTIFSELNRLTQLQIYYNNCHKSSLTRTWNEIRDDPNKLIVSWLPTFFDHLLALWHREVTWCGQVFPEPITALCNLLCQTLKSLNPSIDDCIKKALNDEDDPLALLIQLQTITLRFVQGLQKAVHAFQDSTRVPGDDGSLELISTVQAPFLPYLMQYSTLQQSSLMKVVDALSQNTADLSETAEVMMDSISRAFSAADESLKSCGQFTRWYGAAGLLQALQIFFSAYFGRLDAMLIYARKHCHLADEVNPIDEKSEDDQWSNFQYAFKIIETCGVLFKRMEDFRLTLYSQLERNLTKIFSEIPHIVDNANYNYLKTNKPMEWDKVVELHDRLLSGSVDIILPTSQENVLRLNEHAHKFAFDIVFVNFKRQLSTLPRSPIWSESQKEAVDGDLPTFSLSPLSYITNVGDSLLMLPQQLENFFCQENEALMLALKLGKIPYQNERDSQGAIYDHSWLESFALGASHVYTDYIQKIPMLTLHSTRQIIADLEYFFNILSALEVQPNSELASIKELLEVQPSSFVEKADELQTPLTLTRSISKLRNISMA